jgi:hypothetical protein
MKRINWSSDKDDTLIRLKSEKKTWDEIAKQMSSTHVAVESRFHILQRKGKAAYFKTVLCDQLENILLFYKENGHCATINKFGSYAVKFLQKRKLWKRTLNIVKVYPEQFLQSKDRYYWAGFIAADGCIKSDTHLDIGLSDKDVAHLKKIHALAGGTLYTNIRNRATWDTHQARPIIDFLKTLNITKRKTKTLRPPKNLNEEQSKDFIRGYIDGDGCYTCSWQKRGCFVQVISACGTKCMLEWIRLCLKNWAGSEARTSIRKDRGISVLSYGSQHDFECIGQWLYSNKAGERLERKFDKFFQILDVMKKYCNRT